MRRMLLATSFLILCTAAPVRAASVRLAWDPCKDPAVVGYKIHYGVESGKYTHTVQVKGRNVKEAAVEDLEEGKTYYFAITSYDAKGRESAYSVEISNGPPQKQVKKLIGRTGKLPVPRRATGARVAQGAQNGAATDQENSRKKIPPSKKPARTPDGKIPPSKKVKTGVHASGT